MTVKEMAKLGGKKRAESLSPKRRREIAMMGVKARGLGPAEGEIRPKEEVRRAVRQMNGLAGECGNNGLVDLARAASDVSRALAWAIGDPSDFGELLESLDQVDRAKRQ